MKSNSEPRSLVNTQTTTREYDFWSYLYDCSTIIEVFDKTFDPADQYPEYAVVSLCKSLMANKYYSDADQG